MPVINALAGLTPTATAIPMQSGNATRKTTSYDKKSALMFENSLGEEDVTVLIIKLTNKDDRGVDVT